MQFSLNSMEKSRFFAEGEPLKLYESSHQISISKSFDRIFETIRFFENLIKVRQQQQEQQQQQIHS